jgi:hypothetical protein
MLHTPPGPAGAAGFVAGLAAGLDAGLAETFAGGLAAAFAKGLAAGFAATFAVGQAFTFNAGVAVTFADVQVRLLWPGMPQEPHTRPVLAREVKLVCPFL